MTRIWVISALVVAILVSFAVGDSVGQRTMLSRMRVEFNGTQATLTYNRIADEHEVASFLQKGCVAQAQSELSYYEDKNTELLSEFFAGQLDPSDAKYISDRDPNLVSSLPTFKSKFGAHWQVPECK